MAKATSGRAEALPTLFILKGIYVPQSRHNSPAWQTAVCPHSTTSAPNSQPKTNHKHQKDPWVRGEDQSQTVETKGNRAAYSKRQVVTGDTKWCLSEARQAIKMDENMTKVWCGGVKLQLTHSSQLLTSGITEGVWSFGSMPNHHQTTPENQVSQRCSNL